MSGRDKNPYADTLNLPQTAFPMRAGLSAREPGWVQQWLDEDLYGKMRANRAGADKFIVHLGPPYANGHMHMGHALTYVLKDFIVRSKFMSGYDSPYVPGWDCHGLPIEWKVEQGIRESGKTRHDFSIKEIRDKCRSYASEWIATQMAEWQRFGCLGDWEDPYKTMNFKNEAGIVRELGKTLRRGLLYKGLRSTMWSTVEETALAEAEIEYKDKESTAVFVKFPVVGEENEFVVIWTTTPWTLPANRAIAYAEEETYVALKVESVNEGSLAKVGDTYWLAGKLQAEFIRAVGMSEFATVGKKVGKEFAGMQTQHPFYDRTAPLMAGFHVTTDAGTGFVHIAPAHGQEDFQIGKEAELDLHCPVQADGCYDETVADLPTTGEALQGINIWQAQDKILAETQQNGSLVHSYKMTHSYPVSWRSKAPLIFRATEQWFIGLDIPVAALENKTLREAALARIHAHNGQQGVQWVPGYGENRIGSMIANRPDWCISRQRAWGVPITIFTNKKTGEPVADEAVWEHIAAQVERLGIDAWETLSTEELLPDGWLEANGLTADDLTKATDIMDVWIDSGTSHAHVIRRENEQKGEASRFHRTDGKRPADLYLEGSDQHRGWFHSSLLTSVANYGDAPYETVVTNGFVVDGEGRKFSKSLGNGVEPRELLDTYGMDIIRLWVASSDYSEDIRYSEEIMKGMAEAYRRFRNTFRFLLGNMNGFTEADAVAHADLPALEQYMLHRLGQVLAQVQGHYDAFHFHKGYQVLYAFCNQDLSNFYFDVRKDVLYCDATDAARRQACQTVLMAIFKGLATHLAPLIPFTTDEAWRACFGEDQSVHLQEFTALEQAWQLDDAAALRWTTALQVRDEVNQRIEDELRTKGEVGANTDVAVTLADLHGLSVDTWQEVLNVSRVTAGAAQAVAKASGEKCPRCWTYHDALTDEGVCQRCDQAVSAYKQAAA